MGIKNKKPSPTEILKERITHLELKLGAEQAKHKAVIEALLDLGLRQVIADMITDSIDDNSSDELENRLDEMESKVQDLDDSLDNLTVSR